MDYLLYSSRVSFFLLPLKNYLLSRHYDNVPLETLKKILSIIPLSEKLIYFIFSPFLGSPSPYVICVFEYLHS